MCKKASISVGQSRGQRLPWWLQLLAFGVMLLSLQCVCAQTLIWDPLQHGTSGGSAGSGNWDTTTGNTIWSSGSGDQLWSQTSTTASTYNAVFGAADGIYTVTLDAGQIAATNLTFNNSGYTLSSGALYLPSGAASTITVAANKTATINSAITGPSAQETFTVNPGANLNFGTNLSTIQVVLAGGGTINFNSGFWSPNLFWGKNINFNQLGGTNSVNGTMFLGYAGNTYYTVLNGATLNVNGGNLAICRGGNSGSLTLKSGSTVNVGTTGSTARTLNFSSYDASASEQGALDVQGGTLNVGTGSAASTITFLTDGTAAGQTATMTQEGGVVNVRGMSFGSGTETYSGGSATLMLTGGSLYLGNLGLMEGAVHATDTVTFSGGTVGTLTNWSSPMNISLGNNGGPVTFQGANASGVSNNINLSGVLSGAQGFIKTGAGILTLAGANTYCGATVIRAGTVALSGSGSIAYSTNISLGAGAKLDVSGLSNSTFTLNAGTSFSAAGTGTVVGSTAAAIVGSASGTVDLGTNNIILTFDGSHPALYVSQGALHLEGNVWTVNAASLLTNTGTYVIAQVASGGIVSSGTASVNGTALVGAQAHIAFSGGQVQLVVTSVGTELTVSGLMANNKAYDTTASAAISTNGYLLNGVVVGDVGNVYLVTNGYTATFAGATVGTGQTVTVTGLSLGGSAASKYALQQPVLLMASITNASTTLALTCANTNVPSSWPYAFQAALTSTGWDPTGEPVTFATNGVLLGSANLNAASIASVLAALAPGTCAISAAYAGDANVSGCTNSVTLALGAINFTAWGWDANTSLAGAQDGSGTWDTTNANWWNGVTDIVWDSTAADFGGGVDGSAGAYLVTLGSGVTVSNLFFSNSGYTLGGNTLTLVAGGAVTVASGKTATINCTVFDRNNSETWTVNSGAALNVGGGIQGMQPLFQGAGTYYLSGINTPSVTFIKSTVYQNGGSMTPVSTLFVGYEGSGNYGSYTITNSALTMNASYLGIARGGNTGHLIIQNGATVVFGTGGVAQNLVVAQDASGADHAFLDMQGGTLTLGAQSVIEVMASGGGAGESAIVTQEGGVVNAWGGIQFGSATSTYTSPCTNSYTLTGGSLLLGSVGFSPGTNHPSSSTVTLSGGTLGALEDWATTMPISLGNGGGPVTIQVGDAGGTAFDITLSGPLSGSQGFAMTGGGTLTLAGTNTYGGSVTVNDGTVMFTGANPYSGATTVNGATMLITGGGSATGSSGFALTNGGELILMNSAAANLNNRISNAAPIVLNSGDFAFINDGSAANYSETAGPLVVNSGANTVTAYPASIGQTSTLTFNSLAYNGGSVDFLIGSAGTSQNKVFFATPPSLGSWITVNGDPAAYDSTNGLHSAAVYLDIAALGSTITNGSSSNVRINYTGSGGNIQLSATTTAINSLQQNTATPATVATVGEALLVNQLAINAGLAPLTIGAAPGDGVLSAATAGGNLNLVNNGGSGAGLTINSVLANSGSPSSLTVAGSGTVTLAAPHNSYSGGTVISNATLAVATGASAAMSYTDMGGNLRVSQGGAGTALAMNSLTFGGETPQLSFNVGGLSAASAPLINLAGNLVMSGNVLVSVTNAQPGTGVLLQYSGTRSGTGRFIPGNVPAGLAVIDDSASHSVYFVYVSGPTVIVPPHNTNQIVVAVATPQQYGAAGDGVTDDSAAFQNAMIAVSNPGGLGGGVLYVPAGTYCFSNTLTIPLGVTLQGDWTDWSQGTNGVVGTLFEVYAGAGQSNGTPFIAMNGGALNGVSIWYPNQNPSGITPYPFTIQVCGDGLVQNVALINSYQGIFGSASTHHVLSTIIGSPLCNGITLDQSADICQQEDIRFSPDFWPASQLPGAPVSGGPHAVWMRANGIGELLYRNDGEQIMDLNLSGYNIGVKGSVSTWGSVPGGPSISFYGGYISNCATAYLDDSGGGNTGQEFTQMILDGDTAVARTGAGSASAFFHSCTLNGHTGTSLLMVGGSTGSKMQFQNCNFNGAIQLEAGFVNVVNSTLAVPAGGNQCVISSGAVYANFTGCSFSPTQSLVNAASPQQLIIDGRRASSSPLPVVPWSNIASNRVTRRPATLDLFVATAAPWNAPTDGATDATAAIQAALNAANTNGGGIVYLPSGKYFLSGTLDVPGGVELRGSFPSVHQEGLYDGNMKVTLLQPYGGAGTTNGPPAVVLEANSGVVGLTIHYELQNTNCTPYPPTIQGRGGNVYAIGVLCSDAYWLADLNTYTCTNHFLQQVDGWAIDCGFAIGNGSSGAVVQSMANSSYWGSANYSTSDFPGSWQTTILNFAYANNNWFLLGNCTDLLLKDFQIFNHFFLHCVDQNGRGPLVTSILSDGDGCDIPYQFDAADPACQINVVNPEWMCAGFGGFATNAGVIASPTFQGKARFFNAPLWGGRAWDYWIQGGDVGFELTHSSYLGSYGSRVDGGVAHFINCGWEGNASSAYTIPFNSSSAGVPGKLSEMIGCYAWTGVTNSKVNVNNPVNCWGNFGINSPANYPMVNVTPPWLQFHPTLSAGSATLLWSNNQGAFDLYATPSLAPPRVWTPVTNTPYYSAGNWFVTNSTATATQLFYELQP